MILGYILISLTWLITLVATIYFWILKNVEPPWINWVILAVIAFFPLVQKIKVGDLIEFNKKVSGLQKEVNQIKHVVSNIQTQQLINVSIQGEKEAHAFAEAISSKVQINFPMDNKDNAFAPNNATQYESTSLSDDDLRLFFLEAADQYLNMFTPILNILYYVKLYKQQKSHPKAEDVLQKPPLEAISELQDNREIVFGVFSDFSAKSEAHLTALRELMILRQAVYDHTAKSLNILKGREIIRNAANAVGFLTAAISVCTALIFESTALIHKDKIVLLNNEGGPQMTK